MPTTTNCAAWRLLSPLVLLSLGACATNSPQPPQDPPRSIQLTPLPASVTQIGLKPSESWLAKVQSYLEKVEVFSNDATPK